MLQLDRYNITSRTTTTSTRGGVGGGVDHDEFDGGRSVDTKSSRGTTVSDDRVVREKELHDLRSKKLAKCLREQFEHNGKQNHKLVVVVFLSSEVRYIFATLVDNMSKHHHSFFLLF